MKMSICELAGESGIRDEQWRSHAAGCSDCRELLAVGEWMTTFAASTSPSRDLPAAGYLLFKARLRERVYAVDRAARPVNAMMIGMGVFLTAATAIGVMLGRETRFGSIIIEAFWLLATYIPLIFLAAAFAVSVCGAVIFFDLKNRKANKV